MPEPAAVARTSGCPGGSLIGRTPTRSRDSRSDRHVRGGVPDHAPRTGLAVLRLLLFVLPLGLDSFAVAAALGALGPSRRERRRIAALFVAFEAGFGDSSAAGTDASASAARFSGRVNSIFAHR
jgi:hypothetical protein